MKRHRLLPWLLLGGLLCIGVALNWPIYPQTSGSETQRFLRRRSRRPNPWHQATDKERKAAQASIVAQLEAFKRKDYQKAMTYQSEVLKRNFPSMEAFRRMISTYPQFAQYKSVRFGRTQSAAQGQFVQLEVGVTGTDGASVVAIYLMRLENKIYRVASVDGGRPLRRLPQKPVDETQSA